MDRLKAFREKTATKQFLDGGIGGKTERVSEEIFEKSCSRHETKQNNPEKRKIDIPKR